MSLNDLLILAEIGLLCVLIGWLVALPVLIFCWKRSQKLHGVNPDNKTLWRFINQ